MCLTRLTIALSAVLLSSARPASGELAVQVILNVRGSTYGVNTFEQPPDCEGAVGPLHFVELINGRFAVYRKSTGTVAQSKTDSAFWENAGITFPGGDAVSDPRVVFDPSSQRWFASAILYNPVTLVGGSFMLAVSSSSDPTNAWKAVTIVADPVNGNMPDFPTLGLDANGVYLSANMFEPNSGPPVGSSLFSIPKADLLLATPTATNATSFGILDYGTYGSVLQPAYNPGGTNTAQVVAVGDLGIDFAFHSNVVIFSITNATGPGQAILNSPSSLPVSPYFVPIDAPQPDAAAAPLDNGDARFSAVVRQVGDVIYAVHAEEVNPQLDSNSNWVGQAAIRWYKISAADSSILQSGTLTDPVLQYFYPSVAANADGTVVIGCNGSSTNSFVGSYAFVGETVAGVTTFGPPLLLKAGTASYSAPDPNRGVSRWGDYSATSLDPADPTTFWTIQMLPIASQTYITQITSLRAVKQPPQPPALTLTLALPNVILSWPASGATFTLQTTPAVAPAADWTPASATYATNGAVVSATVPASSTTAFFRLVLQ
jgi:hypothetical protein